MSAVDDQVARLELERLGGMPRWHVHPEPVLPDPLPVGRARLRTLAAALNTERPATKTNPRKVPA